MRALGWGHAILFCADFSKFASVYSIYILIHARVPLQLVNKTRGIILQIYSMFRRRVVSYVKEKKDERTFRNLDLGCVENTTIRERAVFRK